MTQTLPKAFSTTWSMIFLRVQLMIMGRCKLQFASVTVHTPMFKVQSLSYSDSVGLNGLMELLTEYHFTARDPSAEARN